MAFKRAKPRWKTYEEQVFDHVKEHLPEAKIRKNVRVRGRFSKRKRQIDILLVERTPAGILKTAIDTKLFNRKIDVKAVDALAGFVEDVGAHRGMLITSRGYTKAALKRAFYGPSNLELDILDFSALREFQGLGAIPYSGENAFVMGAPFGWVVDGARTDRRLANMYQRGSDLKSAMQRKEFLYINFWDRKRDPLTAAELDELQVERMRLLGKVTVSHRETVQRPDAVTRMRIADVKRYDCLEVTGFLEFEDVIFFAVLLTPRETQRSNIRRLESVLRQAKPMKVTYDHTARIANIRSRLDQCSSPDKPGPLLREMGRLYREMGKFNESRELLEESFSLDPANRYWTIKQLVPVLAKLGDKTRAMDLMEVLLRLDPHNPTVFNDCVNLAAGWIERTEVLRLIDGLKSELHADPLVQANCDYYAGNVLIPDSRAAARKRLNSARKIFRHALPKDHQVFRALRLVLKQCR